MKNRRIYLIRKRALGDVFWIEPVIRQLASRYRKVIVHTRYNELFENYPLTNVTFKPKLSLAERLLARLEAMINTSFLFINLDRAYESRPKMHFLHAYQLKAGLPLTQEYPRIYFNQPEREKTGPVTEPYVTLHIESYSERNYRNVFGIDWEEIVAFLSQKNIPVIQIGKNGDALRGARHINTSVRDMMVLIRKSLFFIGIDSGPSHIAAALGVPSLIFFGAVNPEYRHFKSLFRGFILQQPCQFAGCFHESAGSEPAICRLVGNAGIPQCANHSTEYLKSHIDLLLKEVV